MENDFPSLKKAVIQLLVVDEADTPITGVEALRQWLIENIEWLIDNNFERLLTILYRIDVSELKVKRLIEQAEGENAAAIIADLILEREVQKIESRKKYSQPRDHKYFDDEAEPWD